LHTVEGKVGDTATMEHNVEASPQIKNRTPFWIYI
jgi:hypothetical protein